ncbi:phosphate starvation-inducible protein PhoH [Vibrio maritimus]|uniref:PhoH-like protein n=1 Tax=Vibrio maritimus TaxID=990268 RepID=A0A090SUI4_9VIBR|nr:phosphate starvation-inducible protein PhoH [Vibrio maritimus]
MANKDRIQRRKARKERRKEERRQARESHLDVTKRKHRNHDENGANNIEKTHIVVKDFEPLRDIHRDFDMTYFANELTVGVGCAGTGKTFRAVLRALKDVFNPALPYEKIILIRTTVAVRDDGHLPGTAEEKAAPYERPFMGIVNEICGRDDAYGILKAKGVIEFHSTSHEQGLTYRNAVIVCDEIQNYTFKELDLITTRRGKDCKTIAVGDFVQDYVTTRKEKSGLAQWMQIVEVMQDLGYAGIVEFSEDDIVRDEFVKNYIKTRNKLKLAA